MAKHKAKNLVTKTKDELLQIRNFGEKSYTELYDKFREIGVLPEHLDPDSDSFQESETDDSESDMDSSE